VLKIPADDVEPPPAVFQEGGLNCVTGMGKYKNRLIILLDINKMLQQTSGKQEGKGPDTKTGVEPAAEARGAAAGKS
jgi:chemotaxis signal transduction protein